MLLQTLLSSIVVSHHSLRTLHSISSRYTQHTSRTHFAKYTDHALVRVGCLNEIEDHGEDQSLPKCSIVMSLHRQDLSCIECRNTCATFRLLVLLFVIYILCVFLLLQMFCLGNLNCSSYCTINLFQ